MQVYLIPASEADAAVRQKMELQRKSWSQATSGTSAGGMG